MKRTKRQQKEWIKLNEQQHLSKRICDAIGCKFTDLVWNTNYQYRGIDYLQIYFPTPKPIYCHFGIDEIKFN